MGGTQLPLFAMTLIIAATLEECLQDVKYWICFVFHPLAPAHKVAVSVPL